MYIYYGGKWPLIESEEFKKNTNTKTLTKYQCNHVIMQCSHESRPEQTGVILYVVKIFMKYVKTHLLEIIVNNAYWY